MAEEPRHTPHTNEPNYLPSQSEGSADFEALTEHLRTPGQAEGELEAVEATEATLPHSTSAKPEKRSLWERIKGLFGR